MESYMSLKCIVRKRNLLAHVSIWTIAALVLTISLTVFKGNLFGIIYLLFFLTFVLLFQTSFSCWARSIKSYCVLLIIYSTSVSLLTYTFQYSSINSLYKHILSEQVLKDIGLEVRSAWFLLVEPSIPLILTILLTLYLLIFHDDFNRFAYLAEEDDTSLSTPLTAGQVCVQQTINGSTFIMLSTTNSSAQVNQESTNDLQVSQVDVNRKASTSNLNNQPSIITSRSDLKRSTKHAAIKNFLNNTVECIWRILETHFIKLVVFMIFRLAVIDICLINLPFLIIVLIALKCPSAARCSCLAATWLISVIVTIRNFSNLTSLRVFDIVSTCGLDAPPPLVSNTYSLLEYIGLNTKTGSPLNKVDHYILVLVLTTLFSFICKHFERRTVKDFELSFGVVFTGIGRREAELGAINGLKYLFNFGFYKFGIEITCLASIIAIANRLDFVAAVYGIILILINIITSKQTLASIWPVLNTVVGMLILIQYFLKLGIPSVLCQAYPWTNMSADFKYWLFLPDYTANQDAQLLLFDFLVMLALCRQAVVFRLMSLNSSYSIFSNGQLEHDISESLFRSRYLPNDEEFEIDDCFSNYTAHSNYLKSTFFKSIYWITLTVVLTAGATKISLFSLGYLIGCFIFLWLGNDAYLMPLRRLIFSWNWFIFYSSLVIFIKVILQLYTCHLHEYLLNHCYILQLLRVVCYRKVNPDTPIASCAGPLPSDELDILWDGLCLMFLLMQRIVFASQYFRHLVQEVKAQQILAARGAELIMATQIEEAKAQDLYEKEVRESIQEKMEHLKSESETTSKFWQRLMSLPHHHQVIRNADKHLFSSTSDNPVSQCRPDDWKFKKAFIPDPLGDELERMNDINGISAVFTRWMKGKPLYGNASGASSHNTNSPRSLNGEAYEKNQDLPDIDTEQDGEQQVDDFQDEALKSFDRISDDEIIEDGKIRAWLDTLNLIVYSILLSASVKLNKLSRSYRYVSRRMAFEKNTLKKQFNLDDERFKSDPIWHKQVISKLSETYTRTNSQYQGTQPNTSLHRIRSALKVIESSVGVGSTGSYQDSAHSSDSPAKSSKASTSSSPVHKQSTRADTLTDPEYHFLKLNMFTQFCRAVAYVFVSNTSLLCLIAIIFNQVLTASLLSLPLPLLAFLWGTLSVPRPTKRFWKTVITYTELVIVIKYVFQFPIWDWDIGNMNPFYYPNLLGIKEITIVYDLILLLTLFLHRSMLKSLGQWNASPNQKPSIELEQVQFTPENYNSITDYNIKTNSDVAQPEEQLQNLEKATQEEDQLDENISSKSSFLLCCKRIYTRISSSIYTFLEHALNTPYKVQTDVYVWMFFCDFLNLLNLIYGFWAFGVGYTNQTVASFLNENSIPFSVLIMLLAQFGSIIVDRAFYLQKNIGGKLIFQLILIVGIHSSLFFALPFATGQMILKGNLPPKAFYVIKCVYFLLSAHQIRSGYPRRVLGNCFARSFGMMNWIAFKVYRAIPLFYDLRLYMDWMWTETTLQFRNWSIMEDMFANLVIRKCELTLEEEYPQPRSKPIGRFSKYLTGGICILFIFAIIWGPLLFFSSIGRAVGVSNPPVKMEFELEFEGFQPILQLRASAQQISLINKIQYDLLNSKFVSLSSQNFLGDYKIGDIAAIELDGQSDTNWEISLPRKESLISYIENNKTLTLKSSWTLHRTKREKSQNFDVTISGSAQQIIGNTSLEFRTALHDMLKNPSSTMTNSDAIKFVVTPPIFPNYLRVPETGEAKPVDVFDNQLRSLNLSYVRLYTADDNQVENSKSWWKAVDLCKHSPANDSYSFWPDNVLPHCNSVVVVTFNNRIFTGLLAIISAFGIIGLYTTFLFFFARLIRNEPAGRVIYTEIPNVDRVYGLIMDTYMMRECKQFELEEKLYAKLLFLYRSPELMIEWSKRDDGLQFDSTGPL